jgi:hypothetical protein
LICKRLPYNIILLVQLYLWDKVTSWKSDKEAPFRAIPNKQKYLFFKHGEEKGKTGPACGVGSYQWEGREHKERLKEAVVGILCTHV